MNPSHEQPLLPPGRPTFWDRLTEKEHRQHLVLICVLLWSILSFLIISRYVLGAVEVQGRSMESTLHDGDRHVVNRLAFHVRDPRRGELVVLHDNIDESLCVKRIIGLPGELIELRQGKVYLNGELFSEPYLTKGTVTFPMTPSSSKPVRIPSGHYYVLGDNRENSADSRLYGPLARQNLIGVISQ